MSSIFFQCESQKLSITPRFVSLTNMNYISMMLHTQGFLHIQPLTSLPNLIIMNNFVRDVCIYVVYVASSTKYQISNLCFCRIPHPVSMYYSLISINMFLFQKNKQTDIRRDLLLVYFHVFWLILTLEICLEKIPVKKTECLV